MQSNGYQLLALAARALFILLAGLIVARAAMLLLREHRARKRLLKRLPDAGMVGEMRDVDSDKGYPLAREGVLGGGRACDIRLRGLRRRQVNFAYVDGKGILLTPCHRRSDTLLDGQPLRRGAYALHGAILRVGGYTLRIRLFAGLNVPHPARYEEQHWQPVYEEELYAPVPAAFTPVAGYAPAPAEEGADAPVFGMSAAPQPYFETQPIPVITPEMMQVPYTPAPEPVYPVQEPAYPPVYTPPEEAAYEDASLPFDAAYPEAEGEPAPFEAPVRHRRSERRREV